MIKQYHTHKRQQQQEEKKQQGNFNQVVFCLFILSYQWQSFILGQLLPSVMVAIGLKKGHCKETLSHPSGFTLAWLTTTMTDFFHFLLLPLCFLIYCMVRKKLTYSLSKWKYGLPKSAYAFIIYCITANVGGPSMNSLFNSMNEMVVINEGAWGAFIFSNFFPHNWKIKKEFVLVFINIFLLALVPLTEISLILYILSILNKLVRCPWFSFCF